MSIMSTGLSHEEASHASSRACTQDDPLVPIAGIRRELGNIARSTVYELFDQGHLPKIKIFNKTFTRSSALRLLKETGASRKAA